MKLKVLIIRIMSMIAIINIFIYIILEFEIDKFIFHIIDNTREFLINIFISIFISILTILIMAIIEYYYEKRKCLEEFYIRAYMIFEKLQHFNMLNYKSQVEFLRQLQNIDFKEFDNSFYNIHFFRKTNYLEEIQKEIFVPIWSIKTFLNENYSNIENYYNKGAKYDEIKIDNLMKDIISKFESICDSETINNIKYSLDNLSQKIYGNKKGDF